MTTFKNVTVLGSFTHPGSPYNVQAYGASPSATAAANAVAIQATIAAALAVGGSVVFIPAGIYDYDTTLTYAGALTIMGAGKGATRLRFTGTGRAIDNATATAITRYVSIRDLTLQYGLIDDGTSDTVDGIRLLHCWNSHVENVDVRGFRYGVVLRDEDDALYGCWWNSVEKCRFYNCLESIRSEKGASGTPNANLYRQNEIHMRDDAAAFGINVTSGDTARLDHNFVEGTGSGGVGTAYKVADTAAFLVGNRAENFNLGVNLTSGAFNAICIGNGIAPPSGKTAWTVTSTSVIRIDFSTDETGIPTMSLGNVPFILEATALVRMDGSLKARTADFARALILESSNGSGTNSPDFAFRDGAGAYLKLRKVGNNVQYLNNADAVIGQIGTGAIIGTAAGSLAFFAGTGSTKPTISGSRGGNAALADLLTKLATMGLITDGSSA